jgi:multiple sugar transport system permease protein|tara:strand:+ start:1393 stop:2307 length:915 start_codon:yes stop_codon:yes gene_type:complete
MTFWERNQLKLAPFLFLAPAILIFLIYVIYPIIDSIWVSFHEWNGFDKNGIRSNGNPNWRWVGLQNYITVFFDDEEFYTSFFNNIRWLIFSFIAIPIGLLLALFVNQQIAGMRYIKSLFYFPFVISSVVIGMIFTWFYNPRYGALAFVLNFFGLDPIPVLADESLATYGIIIASLFPGIAYTMILYITGLTGVNREIIEAGRIDGATGFTMLWHIILPQLKAVTLICIVVTIVGSLRSFDLIAVMTAGGPWGSTEVLAYKVFRESLFNYRMGYGAAIATILFLIMDIYIIWFLIRLYKNERSEK